MIKNFREIKVAFLAFDKIRIMATVSSSRLYLLRVLITTEINAGIWGWPLYLLSGSKMSFWNCFPLFLLIIVGSFLIVFLTCGAKRGS